VRGWKPADTHAGLSEQILGWLSAEAARASRRKRSDACGSRASSTAILILLMSFALGTLPIPKMARLLEAQWKQRGTADV
jgi:hypothetical protein